MSVIEIFQTGATGRVIILNLEQVVHAGPKPKQHSSRSSIPEPADVYVRDKCGRDITEHLHRGRPHAWSPLGPPRYGCVRGAKYITGATEWDNLGEWERTHHLRRCVVLLVFLGLILTLNSILCVQDSLTEVCQAVFLHRPQSLE